MLSIFEKFYKAITSGRNQTPSQSNSSSYIEREIIPPGVEVEDAMSIESFRKIAEEGDLRLQEASEVPIELTTNYLRAISNDQKRTQAADQLLKELQGVYNLYKENIDRALVSSVMKSIQPYASKKINDGILF